MIRTSGAGLKALLLTISIGLPQLATAGSADRFKAHMDLLASDLLQGRDTGSEGHEIASRYIASEFQKLGLTPAGDNGTYFQRINFKQAVLDTKSPKLVVSNGKKDVEFKFLEQMIALGDVNRTESSVEGELVFAGFGIDAPWLNYSDFDGVDVKDKIAVILFDRPTNFPSEEGAHYRSKNIESLRKRGAKGVIAAWTPTSEKVRPFNMMKMFVNTPRTNWLEKDGTIHNANAEIQGFNALSLEASKALFALAGMDLDAIFKRIEKGQKPQGKPMGLTAKISYKSTHNTTDSPNVIAIMEGSDPVLKNEYVLLSAHSDHIGVSSHSVKKDRINNGAMDNATGVSTLLEIANELSKPGNQPKRSILFTIVTGEEKGLLGSDYYANNPTVDLNKVVANINLDMPVLVNKFDMMIAFGAQHSSLNGVVSKISADHGFKIIPDPMPEQAIFVRSDQYSYVKKGIPAVFMVPAGRSDNKYGDDEMSNMAFRKSHYHRPSDDLSLPINYEWAAKFVDVNLAITLAVANEKEAPSWNNGSFFKTLAE